MLGEFTGIVGASASEAGYKHPLIILAKGIGAVAEAADRFYIPRLEGDIRIYSTIFVNDTWPVTLEYIVR